MKYLQRLGKAIILPVACMPLCGILMGVGYFLCPTYIQGGVAEGFAAAVGMFLIRSGSALIDHIALLFAVGIGIGMSKDKEGIAGLAGLVAYLTITTLLQADFVGKLLPAVLEDPTRMLAFEKIETPFIGILAGLIGAHTFDRFKDTVLPDWLAFFSGKRCGVIITGLVSVLISVLLMFVWPVLFGGLAALGQGISGLGPAGAGLYAFLNRLLLPFGLHHPLNNVFWFDSIGLGDLTHYWAGETSADTGWSLGIYMSGFFPCMMFGVPGAALAMVHCADKKRRSAVIGILGSGALCSFVCGITEPFEFSFMFISPMLYLVYALLYGLFSFLVALSGFRAGFAFSAGVTDLLFSSALPAAQKTWMILPFGLAAFISFYIIFRGMITLFDIKTPGRETDSEESEETEKQEIAGKDAHSSEISGVQPERILEGLGGMHNIVSLDHCITRLRLEVKDPKAVDRQMLMSAGALGVMKANKNVQVVIGMQVERTAKALQKMMDTERVPGTIKCTERVPGTIKCTGGVVHQPVRGKIIPMEEIPDETFSSGIMGEGVGIIPEEGLVTAPFDGEIVMTAATSHAIGIAAEEMEVLIHVGIDTVNMQGDGFECLVSMGDKVKTGQPLLSFDIEKIKKAGHSEIVAVILTEGQITDD